MQVQLKSTVDPLTTQISVEVEVAALTDTPVAHNAQNCCYCQTLIQITIWHRHRTELWPVDVQILSFTVTERITWLTLELLLVSTLIQWNYVFLHPCGDDIMLQLGEFTRMSISCYPTGAVFWMNIAFWSCIINVSKDLLFNLEQVAILLRCQRTAATAQSWSDHLKIWGRKTTTHGRLTQRLAHIRHWRHEDAEENITDIFRHS